MLLELDVHKSVNVINIFPIIYNFVVFHMDVEKIEWNTIYLPNGLNRKL